MDITPDELTEMVKQLAERVQDDYPATSSILWSLAGSLIAGKEAEMATYLRNWNLAMVEYCKAMREKIRSEKNGAST